ncbi:amidase signature domain-containing protein [Ilyonectria robusta]|uniref:amidase signature domain-containing protein n=1 Tax=Ilyonectria robusta TaxID=1079257 RepID=UPI001E8D3BA1|nr:amidase signature domain-containing protein [Ilyonectria robusta]KAH8738348.1 amidase signature domain-containing protein [Ilyonectria robusta]
MTNVIEDGPLPSLYDADIDTLAKGLACGEFTSHTYNARIHGVNHDLSAVTEINPDALSIASALDTSGQAVQFGASGSRGHYFGETNPSEWGNFRISLNSSNGWSAYGGQTCGPFYPHQDPSGSSSGSGGSCVPRLGLAALCLGGETAGSIIDPASYNNIMEPTSIAGVDPFNNYNSAIPSHADLDLVGACKLTALAGARLGVPRNVLSLMASNEAMIKAFDKSLHVLRSAGALVIENTNFPAAKEFINNSLLSAQIMGGDFVVNMEKYLKHPLEGYPDKPTELWDAALQNWNNTEYGFWRAYQQGLYYGDEGGLLGAIKRYNLDAIVLPSHFSWDWAAVAGAPIVSVPIGAMPPGQPIVSDADGLVSAAPNIPFGFSFLGARFTDAKLIGLGYAFEQRTMIRKTVHPYIAPRTDLGSVVGEARRVERILE